jgi:hypothetical protein
MDSSKTTIYTGNKVETYNGHPTEWLMRNFTQMPTNCAIYYGEHPTFEDNVTPKNLADINKLQNLHGTFSIYMAPRIISTTAYYVFAVIVAIAFVGTYVYMQRMKKSLKNTSADTSTQSDATNNELTDRENTARPLERIPEIYGEVLAVPDLVEEPLIFYSDSLQYEESLMVICYPVTPNAKYKNVFDDTVSLNSLTGYEWCNIVRIWVTDIFDNTWVGNHAFVALYEAVFDSGRSYRKLGTVTGQDIPVTQYTTDNWVPTNDWIDGSSTDDQVLITIEAPNDGTTVTNPFHNLVFNVTFPSGMFAINTNGDYYDYPAEQTGFLSICMINLHWILYGVGGAKLYESSADTDESTYYVSATDNEKNNSHKEYTFMARSFSCPPLDAYLQGENGAAVASISIYFRVSIPSDSLLGVQQQFTSASLESVYYSLVSDVRSTSYSQMPASNCTWIAVIEKAGSQVAALQERKTYVDYLTMQLQYDNTGKQINLTGSKRFIDCIISCCKAHFSSTAAIDIDYANFNTVYNQVVAHFGSAQAAEFCYAFGNTNYTPEQMMQAMATAAFCTLYRIGSKLQLVFEGPDKAPTLLYNNRNIIPGSFQKTQGFGSYNNYTAVSIDWTNPANQDQTETYYYPAQASDDNTNKISIIGIRNKDQARWQAMRAYYKDIFQSAAIEFDCILSGELLMVDDVILVVDQIGQIIMQGSLLQDTYVNDAMEFMVPYNDSLILNTSKVTSGTIDGSLFVQQTDGVVWSGAATLNLAATTTTSGFPCCIITAANAPTSSYSARDNAFLNSTYTFVPSSISVAVPPKQYIVTERTLNDDNQTCHVKALSYSNDFYIGDGLTEEQVAAFSVPTIIGTIPDISISAGEVQTIDVAQYFTGTPAISQYVVLSQDGSVGPAGIFVTGSTIKITAPSSVINWNLEVIAVNALGASQPQLFKVIGTSYPPSITAALPTSTLDYNTPVSINLANYFNPGSPAGTYSLAPGAPTWLHISGSTLSATYTDTAPTSETPVTQIINTGVICTNTLGSTTTNPITITVQMLPPQVIGSVADITVTPQNTPVSIDLSHIYNFYGIAAEVEVYLNPHIDGQWTYDATTEMLTTSWDNERGTTTVRLGVQNKAGVADDVTFQATFMNPADTAPTLTGTPLPDIAFPDDGSGSPFVIKLVPTDYINYGEPYATITVTCSDNRFSYCFLYDSYYHEIPIGFGNEAFILVGGFDGGAGTMPMPPAGVYNMTYTVTATNGKGSVSLTGNCQYTIPS